MATVPIWKRQGYATRNQYRNHLARQKINPLTGKHYTSYRQQRDAEAKLRGKPRDTRREREVARTNRIKRAGDAGLFLPGKRKDVAERFAQSEFGISLSRVHSMDTENRKHWAEVQELAKKVKSTKFPVKLHTYNPPAPTAKGASTKEYIGYIVSYYHSFVDSKHNWESKLDTNHQWKMTEKRGRFQGRVVEGGIFPQDDEWWRLFLTEYAHIYSTDYYDKRYGIG